MNDQEYYTCTSCEKYEPNEVTERYSFGYYAGRLCLKCCGKYRDNCGETQGRVEDLAEFEAGGYAAIEGED